MKKLFLMLVCSILFALPALAASYYGMTISNVSNSSFTVIYFDGNNNDEETTKDFTSGTSSASIRVSTTENKSYIIIKASSGNVLSSVVYQSSNYSSGVSLPIKDSTGDNQYSNIEYDDNHDKLYEWTNSIVLRSNILKVTTATIDSARDKSFTVEADNYDNFSMTRYDGTAIDLSADSKTVKYGDITNDKQYYISAADGKSLVDVSVNGTSVASSVSQYILERSALADGATVSITTEYPEVNYDFSITLGNNTPTDCFLSILVDGEEVAFSDLKSSYKMGTVIKFTPSPKYKFSAFSVSPDPDSKYNAYSDPWEITISANTKVTATASAVDVYTITATLIGESGSANITTGGNTYTLSSGASTQIYYPQSAEGATIYINNGDPTNYQISSIKINGTDVESISQGASFANYNYISGDATIEVTTADLLAGKITFNFDNYENVNLRDPNYNTLVLTSNTYVYKFDPEISNSLNFTFFPTTNVNRDDIKVKLNDESISVNYSGYAYIYGAKNGDVITIKTMPSTTMYKFSATGDFGGLSWAETFSYVSAGSTYFTALSDFASEYLEDTQIDFVFNSNVTVEYFKVNDKEITPAFGTTYRVKMTEDTAVDFKVAATATDWTLNVNVAEPEYVVLRDVANNYTAISLVAGDNKISTENGRQYIVEWQVNDGSTMSSITFNGNDITPTNAAQNNVTITVTADNQSLVINNIAPKELNDLLSVKVTVAAFSGNIDFVDKDSNSLGTIRVTGTNLEGQEIKFNISDHAPISIIFYDEQPTLVLVNDETIALDHTAQDESEDGDGEDNSGSLANETVRYYYVVAADKLVSGTNTVDISMDALSGINSILADGLSNDVYNLQGICVLRQANKAQLRQLPAGLYIMNGKKIAIK